MRISDWSSDVCSSDLITHVPVRIHERDRQIGTGAPLQKKYERICFEKGRINQQPVATFVCPGHPLLEAVISIVREQYEQIMRQGAILVDDLDAGPDLSAVFLLEHSIQDGLATLAGKPGSEDRRAGKAGVSPCTSGGRRVA